MFGELQRSGVGRKTEMTPEGQLEMSWKREAGVTEIVTKGLECYAKKWHYLLHQSGH